MNIKRKCQISRMPLHLSFVFVCNFRHFDSCVIPFRKTTALYPYLQRPVSPEKHVAGYKLGTFLQYIWKKKKFRKNLPFHDRPPFSLFTLCGYGANRLPPLVTDLIKTISYFITFLQQVDQNSSTNIPEISVILRKSPEFLLKNECYTVADSILL